MTAAEIIAIASLCVSIYLWIKDQANKSRESLKKSEREVMENRMATLEKRVDTGESTTGDLMNRLQAAETRTTEQHGYTKRVSEELSSYNTTLAAVQNQLTQLTRDMLTKTEFHQIIDLIQRK